VIEDARARRAAPTSIDLLHGLAAKGDFAREVLRLRGVDIDILAEQVAEQGDNVDSADSVDTVVDRATDCARDFNDGYVGSEHLLLALAAAPPTEPVAAGLRHRGIEQAELKLMVTWVAAGFKFARASGGLAASSR